MARKVCHTILPGPALWPMNIHAAELPHPILGSRPHQRRGLATRGCEHLRAPDPNPGYPGPAAYGRQHQSRLPVLRPAQPQQQVSSSARPVDPGAEPSGRRSVDRNSPCQWHGRGSVPCNRSRGRPRTVLLDGHVVCRRPGPWQSIAGHDPGAAANVGPHVVERQHLAVHALNPYAQGDCGRALRPEARYPAMVRTASPCYGLPIFMCLTSKTKKN